MLSRIPRLHAWVPVPIGHSPHREVTVELTGSGDVTTVRFNRSWLRDAHEANLARQLTATFQAEYE
ncbi:hypothetical protein AB0L86_24910 [Micromonospora musae]|uniref:hypothetical protein n=1 Tax=Micromonospora musae TaxID=1894970 RepID=UPI003415DD4B